MTGRHKFSELEESMTPERRTRIGRMAEQLGKQIDLVQADAEPRLAEAVLQLLRQHPDGLTPRQIIEKLRLKGGSQHAQSISNVLDALTKANRFAGRDRKYVSA
jgi:hypothetical protein